MATVVEGERKVPFSIATTLRYREGATPFPGLLHFTLYTYLIMLSVKQGGIKYHFLSLWYDSTWDWTSVSIVIGEYIVFIERYRKTEKLYKKQSKSKETIIIWDFATQNDRKIESNRPDIVVKDYKRKTSLFTYMSVSTVNCISIKVLKNILNTKTLK